MVSLIEQDIHVERGVGVSVPEQIVRSIRRLVDDGILQARDVLPSSRALAAHLGVSRGSVMTAYDQLVAEGVVEAAARSCFRVHAEVKARTNRQDENWNSADTKSNSLTTISKEVLVDLTGGADVSHADDALWRRAWREAAYPDRVESHPTAAGSERLRRALSEHLRLVRAIDASPDDLIVTSGARDGLAVTLRAMRQRLGREARVAVESPGFPGLRNALQHSGVELVQLNSDAYGPLPCERAVDLVLLTPNHQFPYGSALSSARRQLLLEWARAIQAWVVEDDFDSEFRHLGPPLPALWSSASGNVIHLGTFARVWGREIASGYVAAPRELRADFVAARTHSGAPVAPMMQRAIAGYLESGGVRRHIARGRRRLVKTQKIVRTATAELAHLPLTDTGHLLVIELDAEQAQRVQRECRERGVAVGLLADGWSGDTERHGIVVAYGTQSPDAVSRGLDVLSHTLTS